jgi:hypothetical protein
MDKDELLKREGIAIRKQEAAFLRMLDARAFLTFEKSGGDGLPSQRAINEFETADAEWEASKKKSSWIREEIRKLEPAQKPSV